MIISYTNKGGNTNDPYVAMGLNLTLENMASNLSTCSEISYDYKGAAHNFKVVMAGDPKGELTGYDRHFVAVDASTGWTTATISWSALKQNGWGKSVILDKTKVSAFHWEVKGSTSVDYLYVDNFTCVGLNVTDFPQPFCFKSDQEIVAVVQPVEASTTTKWRS